MTGKEGRSLAEVHGSVPVPRDGSWLRRLFAFAGPAYLVSVGYMDPGNWATDLAGGARFGYQLVWVLLMSNLMAVLLQTLAARLGVVTGKDLAQSCRDAYPAAMVLPLWVLCEVAIVACDLAEVLGAAIGLHLLFGIPLVWGVLVTALDVLLLLSLSRLGMRRLEAVIVTMVATMGLCFAVEVVLSRPDVPDLLRHFVPRDAEGRPSLFGRDASGAITVLGLRRESLYVAMGILGATVMPHNLYLHSALVQTRAVEASIEGKRNACRMNLVDTAVALNAAFFVNAAILVLAAAAFHERGLTEVARIEDAHRLLAPLLGTSLASTLFALALLCSGQSSTITGTLAGQIVMEGFLRIRIRPWLRRLVSRSLAIVPAVLVIALRGPDSVSDLLVLSQVVLSLQLSFAVLPLVAFTSDRRRMGEFVNPPWVTALAVVAAAIIAGLNATLVAQQLAAWTAAAGDRAAWLWIAVVPALLAVGALLAAVALAPWLGRVWPRIFPVVRGAVAVPVAAGSGGLRVAGGEPHAFAAEEHRRVAVALELGSADGAVLAALERMILHPEAEIVLLHVVESAAGRYLGDETSDEETRADRETLEGHAAVLRAAGLTTRVRLGHGNVVAELSRLVREAEADLLVAGSHGHRLLGDVIFGATTSALRHRVRCPVLIVPSDGVPRR